MVRIETEDKDRIHIIRVNGEIDAGSSIHLDNAFKKAFEDEKTKIAVDLKELEYISSAGLGVFVSHLEEMKMNKIDMVIFGIKETVKQVFDILGLEKIITMVEEESEAFNILNE